MQDLWRGGAHARPLAGGEDHGDRRHGAPWYEHVLASKLATPFGGSSNGKTPPFGGGYPGSSPGPPVATQRALARNVELLPQCRDDRVRGVALGDDRADAVDARDHPGGLVGGQGADDGEDRGGSGGADALDLVAVERREPQIEDDGVRLLVGGHADRLAPVGRRADDLEARVREDGAGEQAEAGGVVADQDTRLCRHVGRQDATRRVPARPWPRPAHQRPPPKSASTSSSTSSRPAPARAMCPVTPTTTSATSRAITSTAATGCGMNGAGAGASRTPPQSGQRPSTGTAVLPQCSHA